MPQYVPAERVTSALFAMLYGVPPMQVPAVGSGSVARGSAVFPAPVVALGVIVEFAGL